ncbi:MAG: hydantoinase/oxoprolinase family protein, partial [Planctomycetota bacterium]|nr:hydantoinase/oxoprolinase family protein [Planctomycetota bacterium]
EVKERLAADGSVLEPLDEDDARRQFLGLREAGVESVAVCLLHAYRNPRQHSGAKRRQRTVSSSSPPTIHSTGLRSGAQLA